MNPSQVKFLNTTLRWNNFLTFFGLNCVKETGRDVNNIRYVISPARAIHCLFIFIFIVSLCVYQRQFVHISHQNIAFDIMSIYLTYSGISQTLLQLLTNLLQSKKYARLLNKVVKCEFNFPNTEVKTATRRAAVLFIFFCSFFLVSFTFDMVSRRKDGLNFHMVYSIAMAYIFLMYNLIGVSHFSTAQLWMEKSFLRINEDLVKYCSVGRMETGNSKAVKDQTKFSIQEKYYKKINSNRNFFIKDCKIVENIKRLRIVYNDVFKLTRETDELFATRNVIVLLANFCMSTVLLFYALQSLNMYTRTSVDLYRVNMITMLKGASLSLVSIFGLIYPCGGTCKEAYKTALIIQDSLVCVKHEELRAELKEFSMQVQTEQVYFSPHGLFVLENRMFIHVLATISSYLVILIQLLPEGLFTY